MSLLDGLKDALVNPLFDAVNEADIDADFDFEMALEAVIDKHIELNEDDYAAIMDDNNPDNIVADLGRRDENVSKIAEDAIDDDLKSLESALNEFLASESINDGVDCGLSENDKDKGKAIEMDEDDLEYDEDDDDANEYDDDDYLSLDSLLNSIF